MKSERWANMVTVARKNKNLAMYEVADKVGIDRTYMTRIEKHHFIPSPKIALKLSEVLAAPEIFNDLFVEIVRIVHEKCVSVITESRGEG